MLFLGSIVFGLATSLYGPTRFTIFTDIYENRAGTAVGLSHASGSIGNTLLPILAAGIASHASWRLGYAILIPAFLAVTIALWVWVPSRTSAGHLDTDQGVVALIRRITSSIATKGIPTVVAVQILLGFTSQGLLGFFPTYLIEIKGFSPTIAATLFGAYFAVGILIQPLTGLGNDRFGPRVTLAMLVLFYSIGLFGLYFANTVLHIALLIVLLSHRNGTGIVTNTFIADALQDEIKGSGLGFLRSVWLLVAATCPVIVGYLGDLGLLREAYLMLAILAGLAALLTFFIPKGVYVDSSESG
jgi:MFS family permease